MSLRVVRSTDRRPDEGSGAMVREAAISRDLVGAERIWVGYVELPAGATSAVHHHGEAESAIYIISGRARFYFGDGLAQRADTDAGDFIFVPPHQVHVELNRSETDPVTMVVVRSTQQFLVFNVDAPEGFSPDRG